MPSLAPPFRPLKAPSLDGPRSTCALITPSRATITHQQEKHATHPIDHPHSLIRSAPIVEQASFAPPTNAKEQTHPPQSGGKPHTLQKATPPFPT
ncbi:hypothetical protein [Roseibacillus persicicus]|uniref:hypothetical protein n=1 Tax=Roseibacillus persicicus TaxID=454148 RepID=UPI0036721B1F